MNDLYLFWLTLIFLSISERAFPSWWKIKLLECTYFSFYSQMTKCSYDFRKTTWGTFLVVQWLRLALEMTEDAGSVTGQETKITYAM